MTLGLVHVTILDKNVEKNGHKDKALECTGNYKIILPPSPPKKTMLKARWIISDLD